MNKKDLEEIIIGMDAISHLNEGELIGKKEKNKMFASILNQGSIQPPPCKKGWLEVEDGFEF